MTTGTNLFQQRLPRNLKTELCAQVSYSVEKAQARKRTVLMIRNLSWPKSKEEDIDITSDSDNDEDELEIL